jgi:hypothetical protein
VLVNLCSDSLLFACSFSLNSFLGVLHLPVGFIV